MSTLQDVGAVPQAVVSEVPATIEGAAALLPAMPDGRVVLFIEMAGEEKQRFADLERAGLNELEHRIRDRKKQNPEARAIPHQRYEIELLDEFTPYRADVAKLREAQPMLPEEEAAKLLVHRRGQIIVTLPEQTDPAALRCISDFAKQFVGYMEVATPHDEPGNTTSILALAKKYAGTPVGDLLASAISRDRTGDKLLFKRRKGLR